MDGYVGPMKQTPFACIYIYTCTYESIYIYEEKHIHIFIYIISIYINIQVHMMDRYVGPMKQTPSATILNNKNICSFLHKLPSQISPIIL
jgi:hypothetical protein